MNIIAIVQARMTSTRLPGKTMRILSGKPLLQHVVDNLKKSKNIDKLVVATTTDSEDDIIDLWCKKNSIFSYRGDREDVLSRFYECALKYKADAIVRVTSDCPLIDSIIVDSVIDLFKTTNSDYATNSLIKSFPHGLDIEIFSFDALRESFENTKKQNDREHVTQYIRSRPEKFKLTNFLSSGDYSGVYSSIRVTIDEDEDFELVELIINKLGNDINLKDLLKLYQEDPDLFNINKGAKSRHKEYYEKQNII